MKNSAVERIRQEVEAVLTRHALPASRDRVAMGVLIDHSYRKMRRKLEKFITQTIQKQMGAEQSHPSRRVRQDDALSWTGSLSSSHSNAWTSDITETSDTVDACSTPERLTQQSDAPVCFLSLAFEDLTVLPTRKISSALLSSVKSLDLTNNRFRDVQFLADFEGLTTVNLDHNRIDCLTTFPKMPSLHSLSLNHNRIVMIVPFVPSLAAQCPNLRFLSLMANEVCPNYLNGGTEQQNEQYRDAVLGYFPKLEYLDDSPVTQLERERALESTSGTQGYQCSLDEGIDTE